MYSHTWPDEVEFRSPACKRSAQPMRPMNVGIHVLKLNKCEAVAVRIDLQDR